MSVVLLSLIDKVVTLHKKLEDVKKDIKEVERGVILKINQLYQNISLSCSNNHRCVHTTGLEAHSHCDRIVKEAAWWHIFWSYTVSTCMA